MQPLIGLTGFAGAGKDEAARGLFEKGWVRRSFADQVRQAYLALDPIVGYVIVKDFAPTGSATLTRKRRRPCLRLLDRLRRRPHRVEFNETVVQMRISDLLKSYDWPQIQHDFPEVRQGLQRMGTEAGRDIHGSRCWIHKALDNRPEKTVVTDVRFENEAEAIRRLGGEIIRVDRPGVGPVNAHISDAGLPDHLVDRTVNNFGGIADLHEVMRLAAHIVEKRAKDSPVAGVIDPAEDTE